MKMLMLLAAVVSLAVAVAVKAADEPQLETHTVIVAGVDVAVDRDGRIAPPLAAEQRARLLANLRAQYAARGVYQFDGALHVAADGSESLQLGLAHERITVARIKSNGELETTCVRGDDAAAELLSRETRQ